MLSNNTCHQQKHGVMELSFKGWTQFSFPWKRIEDHTDCCWKLQVKQFNTTYKHSLQQNKFHDLNHEFNITQPADLVTKNKELNADINHQTSIWTISPKTRCSQDDATIHQKKPRKSLRETQKSRTSLLPHWRETRAFHFTKVKLSFLLALASLLYSVDVLV